MDEQPLSARDFGTAFKGFLEQAVTDAPGERPPFTVRIRDHLGIDPGSLSIVGQDFESTDHANVQVALDAYLEPDSRSAEFVGITSPHAGYHALTLAALHALRGLTSGRERLYDPPSGRSRAAISGAGSCCTARPAPARR